MEITKIHGALFDLFTQQPKRRYGPVVKFNAEASAAHQRFHAERDALEKRGNALLEEVNAVTAQIDALNSEHFAALRRHHPEIGRDQRIQIDCGKDGYRLPLPDVAANDAEAPKAPEPPQWAKELAEQIEKGDVV